MHFRSAGLASLLLSSAAGAQSQPATPQELLAAKLASPFLTRAPWITDWDAALARAKASRKLIFGYFTTAAH